MEQKPNMYLKAPRYGALAYNGDVSAYITRDMINIKLATYKDRIRFVLTNFSDYIAGSIWRENRKGYKTWKNTNPTIRCGMSDLNLLPLAASLVDTSGVAAAKRWWNHG
jgi:hypothetical protein